MTRKRMALEEAKSAKGYMHRGVNELIFGYHDEAELRRCIKDVYDEHPELVNRNGMPRGKASIMRGLLEEKMGRPIADTDRDLGGRMPHWVTAYQNGSLTEAVAAITPEYEMPVISTIKEVHVVQKLEGGTHLEAVIRNGDLSTVTVISSSQIEEDVGGCIRFLQALERALKAAK